MRNRAGIIQRCQTGTDEVGYSSVTKTERGGVEVWDAAGTGEGEGLTGNLRDNEGLPENPWLFIMLA